MLMNVFNIKSTLAAAVLGLSSVVAVASGGNTVLDVAKQKGNFNTLAKAIEVAGLQDALTSDGPVTVFAPTDEAFAKLPAEQLEALLRPENKDQLVKILTNHVVAGRALEEDDLKRTRSAKTAAGEEVNIELKRGRVRVEGARVTGDYTADNGVVVAVDSVLIPN
jgi:transforming growth factor-beta-induced protein